MKRFNDALAKRLVERHRCGDFRLGTAAACGVHPRLLDHWLRLGLSVDCEQTKFAMEFITVESDMRAWAIREILASKTMPRQTGLIWFMERRFKQFRKGYEHRGAEGEAFDCLGEMDVAAGGMTREQKLSVVERFVGEPTPEIEELFERAGWVRKVA